MLPDGDHLRVVAQPLPDGGLRLFLEDRTEQLRLASARDTLLRVRAATFDNLFEAISVFASDGRLYLWNRRFLEDWELDEEWLSTHPRVDELVPAMARKLVNPTAAAQIREMVRQTTNERQSANGRIVDDRRPPFPVRRGAAARRQCALHDGRRHRIRRRIEAALRERAAALEEADRVKTDFVANMSYELRTPLTSIGGFAELLGGGYAGELSAKGRGLCRRDPRIGRAAVEADQRRARPHHRRHRAASRWSASGSTSPACAARRSRRPGRARPKRRRSSKPRSRPSPGFVFGDARRLREVDRARAPERHRLHRPQGPHRARAPRATSKQAVIRISDNGPGIAAEDLPRVFDRFDRVGRGGRARRGGARPRPAADPPVHRGARRHGRARSRRRAKARPSP